MFKKLWNFFNKEDKSIQLSVKTMVEDFKKELFVFQTKVFFEFTDSTSDVYHIKYEGKLYSNFQKKSPTLGKKKCIIVVFDEKEFLSNSINKIPNSIRKVIISCLEKQFDNIISSKFSETTHADSNLNKYSVMRVDFEQEEYQSKHLHSIDQFQMKLILDILFEIEHKFNQMIQPEDFVLTFIDTLRTLNETTDKITVYKNLDAIIAILTNMKDTAKIIVSDLIKTDQELSNLEINTKTNSDLIIQLELEFTQMITEKNKKIEALKMIR